MNNWFISDLHYFHFNAIEYANRPFLAKKVEDKIVANGVSYPILETESIEKQIEYHSINWMNDTFTKNWNESIKPEDKVYFLGDFAFSGANKIKYTLSKLNGYKILIKGNHDRSAKSMIQAGFNEVYSSLTIKIADEDVLLSHYPYTALELSKIAKLRPNILKFTQNKNMKLIPFPSKNYQEEREWLAKNMLYPINTTLDESKDYIIKVQRLISKHIGTRLVNDGKILLHGHTHSSTKRFVNMINMSAEAWNYSPASENQIIELINEYKKELNGEFLSLENSDSPTYAYYLKLSETTQDNKFKVISELVQLYNSFLKKKESFKIRYIPKDYSKEWYNLALKLKGFISINNLTNGKFYSGSCRNASWAYWDEPNQTFYYIRSKFGSEFIESINPVEKDNGFDLFIPYEEYQPTQDELTKFWQLKQRGS